MTSPEYGLRRPLHKKTPSSTMGRRRVFSVVPPNFLAMRQALKTDNDYDYRIPNNVGLTRLSLLITSLKLFSVSSSGGIFGRLFVPDFHQLRLACQTENSLLVSINAFLLNLVLDN